MGMRWIRVRVCERGKKREGGMEERERERVGGLGAQ